ncbi:hypothetical protein [uncultured Maribacter sp.]|uniref:hypothetical protein n=1 Tax=uncultured Maribacter sp. TaxID=431308 RepID=UPI0030D933F7|tara:strand:- start:2156 stop:2374 length:219 start_codon:yes stop_codon:yes gene_type:complete
METLEYHETILKKVSFDEELLKIELKKAVRNTTCSQQPALLEWCGKELGPKYKELASSLMKDKDCAFNEPDS